MQNTIDTAEYCPTPGHICGRWLTKEVWIDGNLIEPSVSLQFVRHSPDGFNWSYNGSGPAQLAFGILQHLAGTEFALKNYQHFNAEFLGGLPPTNFAIDVASVRQWILAMQSLVQEGSVQ